MGGPTTPYARQATDISDSSAPGRSVLTGTAAQGATALGLGTSNAPTLSGLIALNGVTLNMSGKQTLIGGGDQTGSEIKLTNSGTAHFSIYNTGGFFTVANASATDQTLTNLPGVPLLKIGTDGAAAFAGQVRLPSYTVAALPAGVAGALVYVSNGRKVGEAAGSGTGVVVAYSNAAWRRLSDDSAVAA